jgi:hypothetical protein
MSSNNDSNQNTPKPPPLPAPNQVPHLYVEKGLGAGRTEKR